MSFGIFLGIGLFAGQLLYNPSTGNLWQNINTNWESLNVDWEDIN